LPTFSCFGDFFQCWRTARGDSRRQVARDLGVAVSNISAWERGTTFPQGLSLVNKICDRTGVTMEQMLKFENIHNEQIKMRKAKRNGEYERKN